MSITDFKNVFKLGTMNAVKDAAGTTPPLFALLPTNVDSPFGPSSNVVKFGRGTSGCAG